MCILKVKAIKSNVVKQIEVDEFRIKIDRAPLKKREIFFMDNITSNNEIQ